MKNLYFTLIFLIIPLIATAQISEKNVDLKKDLNQQEIDSLKKIKEKLKYRIISHYKDTTFIDTTLNIKKEYKFNFLRKDNFGLLAFHNQGQTFNNLTYDFSNNTLYSNFGFRAKHFNYIKTDEIKYYNVPTPSTEVLYRTGMQQGQVLDALLTLNFSKKMNISLAYKGLRSLGHYRESLVSSGNFRSTFNYQTPKNKYTISGHIAIQDIENQESGGLKPLSIINFEKNNKNFKERGRIDVNLNGTKNTLEGKRFFLDHNIALYSFRKDSVNEIFNVKIGHNLEYEKKFYVFNQSEQNAILGFSDNQKIKDKTNFKLFNNQVYLELNSKYLLGKARLKSNYTKITYQYDSIINKTIDFDRIGINNKSLSIGGEWFGKVKNIALETDINIIPGNGNLAGSYFKGKAVYKKDSVFSISAKILQQTKAPNYNFQLFHSSYRNYNWNNTNLKKINTKTISSKFLSKWINAEFSYSTINNFTYFDVKSKPKQYEKTLKYLKAKINNEITFRKFSINNTVLYQKVMNKESVLRVPSLVTRNTIYYTDNWFKGDPLKVNIGITFNYFTKYYANAYNPLLSEFRLQDKNKIGFHTVDLFFNTRVIRTRIYLKADNILSSWSKRNYYSAPLYPYRDFTIRFGLVWNWFI